MAHLLLILLLDLQQRGSTPTPEIVSLKGPPSPVLALAFGPDGKTLAAGNEAGDLELWDIQTRKVRVHLGKPVGDQVTCVAFSTDGKSLAVSNSRGRVMLWDIDKGRRRKLTQQEEPVTALAFSKDDRALFSFSPGLNQQVHESDLTTGRLSPLFQQRGCGAALLVSQDGKQLVSVTGQSTWIFPPNKSFVDVTVWDLQTARLRYSREWINGILLSTPPCLSPSAKTAAAYDCWAGSLRMWDVVGGVERKSIHVTPDRTPIVHLAFSPDDTLLAGALIGKTIRLWSVAQGEQQAVVYLDTQPVTLAFDLQGKTLASGNHDGRIKLWDISGRVPAPAKKVP
jgi:WD40 repeat protein